MRGLHPRAPDPPSKITGDLPGRPPRGRTANLARWQGTSRALLGRCATALPAHENHDPVTDRPIEKMTGSTVDSQPSTPIRSRKPTHGCVRRVLHEGPWAHNYRRSTSCQELRAWTS
jgi:hypothetical protein